MSRSFRFIAHALIGVGMEANHKSPVTITTISDLARNGMTLGLFCVGCQRWGEIMPAEWLGTGRPDVNYVVQRFKCSQCGGAAEKQVRPPPSGFSVGSAYQGLAR
jgi:hypothetical protein